MDYLSMRSPLAKARNTGADANGAHHWWHQRFTSILIIPLVIWIIYFINSAAGKNIEEVMLLLAKPYNITLMILFLATSFYHASLGMTVIIEDYISNIKARTFLVVLLQIFTIVTVLSAIIALLFLGKL